MGVAEICIGTEFCSSRCRLYYAKYFGNWMREIKCEAMWQWECFYRFP